MYKVTIYSPVDKQEQEFNAKDAAALDRIVFALTSMMEVGAWFKIERI